MSMNRALATNPDAVPQLRTRSVWTTDGSGSAVLVTITERMAPHGHWSEVEIGVVPRASNLADIESARLASTWAGRPEHGYPMWYRGPQPGESALWGAGDYDGPIWVDTFGEGETWTPIPHLGEIERLAEQLATAAGNQARDQQIETCERDGCTADRCPDRAAEDATRDEYAFCLERGLEFSRRRRSATHSRDGSILAKHNARVAKARARARKAIEACEQAVTDRCVELSDEGKGPDCDTDAGLKAEYEMVCLDRAHTEEVK